MARRSAAAYRALVYGDPGFPRFFATVTPVDEISRLRLGSRPPRRGEASGIEDYRAIPWVFSWTQARIVLPAWYGFGTALAWAQAAHGLELLREMRATWPFFGALVSNAQMGCAKADLAIGRRYAALCEDDALRERIWGAVEAEYTRTVDGLVAVVGGTRLLDDEPVLQSSIDRRNPYVDPLSFIQLELLRRARAGQRGEALAGTSLLAVNGIASGLRNTG
jgi:phosphoenolpyruvate carboxylase